MTALDTTADAQIVEALLQCLTQHDIDRPGNRPGAEFGRRCAQDLDPLDLIGGQRFEREAGRNALSIDQQLGVATAQAAHPRAAAPSGSTARGHARQTLQYVGNIVVAEAFDFLTSDDDLGGSRPTALLVVVGVGIAGDLHTLQR